MISPDSITNEAFDAYTPSQVLARLAGVLSAHGQDVEVLLALAAEAVCAEQDARTLNQLLGGKINAA